MDIMPLDSKNVTPAMGSMSLVCINDSSDGHRPRMVHATAQMELVASDGSCDSSDGHRGLGL